MYKKLLFVSCIFVTHLLPSLTCNTTHESINATTHKLTITCAPQAQELLFHDSLSVSLDNPHYDITEWKVLNTPISKYTTTFKDTRLVYADPTTIQVLVHEKSATKIPVQVRLQYVTTMTPTPAEYFFQLPVPALDTTTVEKKTAGAQQKPVSEHSLKTLIFGKIKDTIHDLFTQVKAWSVQITNHIQGAHSLLLQIFLIFLLGVLMSLTPCIYPMIPVTIGILQASSATSFWRNFLIAFSYTIGVASTFSVLGLLAATGSAQFGQLAGSPIFIIIIVTILGYLGLSMFGWYTMYIPRFLQPKQKSIKQGSPFSAFIFGAISGTIASPCLSPGLAFVLTIVASLKNMLLGLLLLFAFGVGSSLPLLIIGTFSSSLNVLPKAGTWMVEVKKLFGFMLFGMCFYYLHVIIPLPVLLGIISSFLAIKGVWYFMQVKTHDSKRIKRYKNGMGFILIISSIVLVFHASKDWTCTSEHQTPSVWLTDYAYAQERAKTERKNILIDVTADWCSVCKLIEKKILNAPEVVAALDTVIPVTVNSTQTTSEPYASLKQKYTIVGVPTLLLIDGQTGELIKRWGSELAELDINEFIRQLQ